MKTSHFLSPGRSKAYIRYIRSSWSSGRNKMYMFYSSPFSCSGRNKAYMFCSLFPCSVGKYKPCRYSPSFHRWNWSVTMMYIVMCTNRILLFDMYRMYKNTRSRTYTNYSWYSFLWCRCTKLRYNCRYLLPRTLVIYRISSSSLLKSGMSDIYRACRSYSPIRKGLSL